MPNWKKLIVSGSDATLNSLNVTTNGTFGGAAIFPNVPSDNNVRLINTAATGHSKLEIQDNSNNLLVFISSSGNVGIGTSTSSQKLRVQGNFRVDSGFALISNGAGPTTEYLFYNPTDKALTLNATSSNTTFDPQFLIRQDGNVKAQFGWDDDGGNELFIVNQSTGPIQFKNASSELVRITNSGNLGVGTTNPSQKLEVAGAIHATGSTLIASNDAADSVGLSLRSPASGVNVNFDFEVGDTGISGLHAKNLVIRGSSGASDIAFSPSTSAPGLLVLDGSAGSVIVSGSVDADDVTIDDWGSVSASLATISDAGGVNGSGAAQSIAYWNDADTLEHDTDAAFVYIDGTNTGGQPVGRMGLGTTSPNFKLDIAGGDLRLESNNGIRFGGTGSNNTYWRIFTAGTSTGTLSIGNSASTPFLTVSRGSSTTGFVGIGTTSPSRKLHIHEASGNAYLQLTQGSTGTTNSDGFQIAMGASQVNFINRENGNMVFETNNTERMRIKSDGNVGIGTNNPNAKLHIGPDTLVSGYTPDRSTLAISDITNGGQLIIRGQSPRIWFDTTSGGNAELFLDGSKLNILSGDPTSTGTSRLYIKADGNVGIGNTAPPEKLTVEGNISASGDLYISDVELEGSDNKIRWAGSNNNRIQYNSSTGLTYSAFQQHFKAYDGVSSYVEYLTILDGGNIGIGETSPDNVLHITKDQGGASSALKLENKAGADDTGFDIDFQLASSGLSAKIGTIRTNSPGAGDTDMFFSTSTNGTTATEAMRISHDGNVGIGTASPNQKLSVEGNIELGTGGYIYGDTTTPFLRLNNAAGTTLGYSNGNISIGPSFVYNNASGEQFRINHSNGNVGIGSSSPGKTLDIVGEARVNKLDHYEFLTSTNDSLSFNYATRNLAMPVNGYLWHDLLGFDYNYTRTQEISTNGSTFSSHTLQTALFAQKQDQSVTVLESNEVAVRWTFQGVAWSLPDWMNLAFTHVSNDISKDILIESSADGSTWTTRHTSTVAAGIATKTLFISSFGGDTYLRLTITKTNNSSTNLVKMSSIKLMTARAGDQGQGMEYQFPYTWDYDRRIAIGHSPTTGVYEASLAIKGKTADTTAHALVIRNSSNTSLFSVRNDGRVDIPASSLITGGDVSVGDELTVTTINGTTTDHDKFLVSDSGTVKFVSGSQLLSQIGGASAGDFVTLTTNQTISGVKTFSQDIHLDDDDGASPAVRLIDGDNIAFRILNGGSNQLNITRTGNGGNDMSLEADATSHVDSVIKVGGTSTFGSDTVISGSLTIGSGATAGIIYTNSNKTLKLEPNGNGNIFFGSSTNGTKLYHYNRANNGQNTIFDFDQGFYRLTTTATSGFDFANNTRVSGVLSVTGDTSVGGNLEVAGTVTAQEFHTEFVSASILYDSGSTKFGDTVDDKHDFTGSLEVRMTSSSSSGNRTFIASGSNGVRLQRKGDNNGWAMEYGFNANDGTNLRGFGGYGTGNSALVYNYIGGTYSNPNMAILVDGNVGINTTSPSVKLEVNAGGDNHVATFESTDSIAEIRIKDSAAYSRILNVGTQLKLMPNDGVEMMILDGNDNTVNIPDDKKITFGDADDLRIFHETGNTSKIENYTGNLVIQQRADGENIAFQCDDGSGGLTEYLRFDGGDVKTIVSKTMEFQDTVKLAIGNSEDLIIDHNATNSRITNYTGNLRIINGSDGDDITFEGDNGSGGVTEYFRLDGGAAITIVSREMRFTDNVKAKFGTGPDLEIYHSGTHSFIDGSSGTGSLYIRPGTGGTIQLESQSGTDMITAAASSAKLFQNGNEKLATTAGGVDITGTLNTTGNLTITNTVPSINLTDSDNDSDYTVRNNNGVFEVFDATNNDARLTISSTGYATFASTIKTENGILALGNDVTLFRDGANILRTDDAFHANANIHVGGDGKIFDRAGTNSFIHFDHANSKIRIQEGGEEMITIDSNTVRINAAQGNNDFVIEGNSDTNLLRADGSADRVGIGKATPEDKLDVFGNIRISNPNGSNPADAGSLVFGETGGSWGGGLYGFRFFLDGSNNVLRLQSSTNTDTLDNILVAERDGGNIGIGLANPDTRLHVSSSTGFSIKTERAIQDGARNGHTHFYTAGNAHIFGRPLILESSFRLTPSSPSNTTKSYRIMNNSEILKVALEVGGSTVTDNILTVSGSSVGIGSATPSEKLHIQGGNVLINGAAPYLSIKTTQTGTPDWKIYNSYNSVGDFAIVGGSSVTNKFNIQPNGQVGIGTNAPKGALHLRGSNSGVADNLKDGTLIVEQGSAPSIQILSANSQTQTLEFGDPEDNDAGRVSYSHPTDDMKMFTAGVERMIISGSGNVGIGVSAPAVKLHVDGFARFNGSLQLAGTDRKLLAINNTSLIFGTNNTERMRILAGGNVGIGVTNPGQKLDVNGNAKIRGTLFVETANNHIRLVDTDNSGNFSVGVNTNFQVRDVTNGTTPLTIQAGTIGNALYIKADGYFGIGNSSPKTRLHLSGSSAADAGIRQSRDGVKIWTQEIDSNGKLQWAYRSTEAGSATQHLTLNDTGQATLHGYGSGNFTGTAAKTLAVDSSGNIIETDGGGTIDGSGAANKLAIWSDSDTLTSDTNLHWDTSNDRLGIGVTAPGYTLDVAGTIRVGSGGSIQPLLSRDSATGGLVVSSVNNSGDFIFKGTGGNEKFRITDDGEVGIGTSSPGGHGEILELYKNGADVRLKLHEDAGTHNTILHLRRGGADWEIINMSHLTFNIEGTEVVRFENGGDVGIGTNNPESRLHITDANPVIILEDTSNPNKNKIENVDGNMRYHADYGSDFGNSRHIFFIDNSEKVRFDTNGKVGIGFTSPVNQLDVNGVIMGTGIRFGSQASGEGIMRHNGTGNGNGLAFTTGNFSTSNIALYIDHSANNGKVGIGTVSPEAQLTVKSDPGNTNQPTRITNNSTDSHTGLFLNGTGNAVNEKYGLQFGNYNEYSIGGIFGVMDSVSASTSGDITIDFGNGTAAGALVEKVRFTHEGKVGIGTNNPGGELHVSNTSDFLTDLDGSDSAIVFKESGGNPWRIGNKSADDSFNITQDASSLSTNVRFTISNGGNVGIGTTTPSTLLHIDSTGDAVTFSRTGQETYKITHGTSGLYFTRPNSSALAFGVTQNSDFDIFDTNGDVMFRADASVGRVSIGNSSPTEALDVTGNIRQRAGLRGGYIGSINYAEYYFDTGDAGGSFLIGQIENNGNADGAISATVHFAYDYGTTTNNCTLHFNFAQRSGTARGTWWYEGDDQDSSNDRVHARLIDDGSGNMYVWITCVDFSKVFVETKQRQITNFVSAGQLTAGTLTTGTTLFDTANAPTAEIHVGEVYIQNNKGLVSTNVAGADRTLIELDSNNDLKIKGNDSEGSDNVIKMEAGGVVTLGSYGSGTHTGTSAKSLHVTSTGKIIEKNYAPKVEYQTVSSDIATNTTFTLPNSLSYVLSSGGYEYLEIFLDGIRLNRGIDFEEISTTSIKVLMSIPASSVITYKSII